MLHPSQILINFFDFSTKLNRIRRYFECCILFRPVVIYVLRDVNFVTLLYPRACVQTFMFSPIDALIGPINYEFMTHYWSSNLTFVWLANQI